MSGIFITGTGSNVGKTIVTACLTYAFRQQGIDAVPYKPVQCGAIKEGEKWLAPDVEIYRTVYNQREEEKLNSFLYEPRFSPHFAAQEANRPIKPEVIQDHFLGLQNNHDLVLVEGAGGLAVPLINEHYGIPELIKDLNLPVLIITEAAVGTLNATALTAHYAKSKGLDIKGIIINGYPSNPSKGVKDNPAMIEKMTGLPVIGIVPEVDNAETRIGDKSILDELISGIDLSRIYNDPKITGA